jgi:hypothetical protein
LQNWQGPQLYEINLLGDLILETREQLEQRFWSKVNIKDNPDECWNWIASIDTPGYGGFKYNGKKVNSHRMAYELIHGEIEGVIDVCHTCDNRLCCNPNHLFLGTRRENVRDCMNKNRMFKVGAYAKEHPEIVAFGEKNKNSKLKNQDVFDILYKFFILKEKAVSLYTEYKICKQTFYDYINGDSYKETYLKFMEEYKLN